MRILVACEFSGRVRDAFRALGFDAWSCDLRSAESDPQWHIQGDAIEAAYGQPWDMMIAHPYCTFNCNSGVRWMYHPDDTPLQRGQRRRRPNYPDRMENFMVGVKFFNELKDAPIAHICLENSQPHGLAMEYIGRYDQILQPWHVGSPETKGAALWLKNLPKIKHTHTHELTMIKYTQRVIAWRLDLTEKKKDPEPIQPLRQLSLLSGVDIL